MDKNFNNISFSYCEKILNNILKAKKAAILILDTNLNILYLSESAKKIAAKQAEIKSLSDYFGEYDADEYLKAIKTGKISERIMKRLNKTFYMSILSPIKENGAVVGVIEILEIKDESYLLSYEIKSNHRKAYEISEFEDKIKANNGTVYTLDSIITSNEAMKKLIEKAYKIADSNSPVLIYGDTGTGKELFAQGIHNASKERKSNMFIAQNCAAIPETLLESLLFGTTEGSFTGAKDKPGLFEIAEGGTIYLDEINSMDLNLQAKLLRVLQENTYMPIGGKTVKKSNVRVIASFNEDPISVIKNGKFRRDLYYRLNVIYFKIPGLNDRQEDIKVLTNHFISIYNKKFNKYIVGIKEEAMTVLEKYKWEGNVRELKNNIERIMNFVEGQYIKIEDISNFIAKEAFEKDKSSIALFDYDNGSFEEEITDEFSRRENIITNPDITSKKTFREKIEEMEIAIIKSALNESGGNVALAARYLDLPRQTLKNKIIKYNIKPTY